ncbi:hypothetical protein LguiB_034328 [Lonicera macranthoides]
MLFFESFFPSIQRDLESWNPYQNKRVCMAGLFGKVSTCDKVQVRRPFTSLSPLWCVLCRRDNESIHHILLHCEFVMHVWSKALKMFGLEGAFSKRWSEFLIIKWHFRQNSKKVKQLWRFSLMAIVWLIWSERNRRVFEDRSNDPIDIWEFSCFLIGMWAKASWIFDALDRLLFSLDSVNVVGC